MNEIIIETGFKDKLQEKLLEYLTSLEEAVTKGAELASEQVPATITQYLQYSFFENMVVILFVVFCLMSSIIGCFVTYNKGTKNAFINNKDCLVWKKEHSMIMAAFIVLSMGFATGFLFSSIPRILECIKIKMAPNVYILEKINEML